MLVREFAQRARKRKGFSLVELMVVVAIIAILAAIAVPQYKKYQLKAKTSEARVNLSAIRSVEESYSAEHGYYVLTNWAPASVPQTAPKKFEEGGTNKGFNALEFAPAGKVYYSYAVLDTSNKKADDKSSDDEDDTLSGVQIKATSNTDIHIWAIGDLDGDAGSDIPDLSKIDSSNYGAFMTQDESSDIINKNPGKF